MDIEQRSGIVSPRSAWFSELLAGSYERVVGEPLLPVGHLVGAELAAWLYGDAPFGLLAHDLQDDPRFIYANRAAQRCFEYSWNEFIGMPSRLSAEAPGRAERQEFMDTVRRQGHVSGYRGLRIARSGRRFWIERATVWNLVGRDGVGHGQAALLRGWSDA